MELSIVLGAFLAIVFIGFLGLQKIIEMIADGIVWLNETLQNKYKNPTESHES